MRRCPIHGQGLLPYSVVRILHPSAVVNLTDLHIPAYAAACLASANVTVPKNLVGLTVPADWDGPNGMSMGVPAAVLTVITAALIGVGGISILCSM